MHDEAEENSSRDDGGIFMDIRHRTKKILLDMDLNGILNRVPLGSVIQLHPMHGKFVTSQEYIKSIRKVDENAYISEPDNRPYSKVVIYSDVINQRIHISDLLAIAERNELLKDLEIDEENGRVYAYDTMFQNMRDEQHLKSAVQAKNLNGYHKDKLTDTDSQKHDELMEAMQISKMKKKTSLSDIKSIIKRKRGDANDR